jgi:hypothetical protein
VKLGTTTTPGRLRAHLGALLLATLLLWAFGTVLVARAHAVTGGVAGDTGPAELAARTAHADLVDADRAAVLSFLTGGVRLGGPGQRYQDDITGASQALEQLAEHQAGGAGGSRQLQSVEALLVTYTGLIEQADATHRLDPVTVTSTGTSTGGGLGQANLWYASKLLHDPGSGILARIDDLDRLNARTLADQRGSVWLWPGLAAGFLVAAAALTTLLILAHLMLLRRFRRVVSWLLPALLAVLALTVWTGVVALQTDARAAGAQRTRLPAATALWQARAEATDADGRLALAALLGSGCPAAPAGCPSTVAALLDDLTAQARAHLAAVPALPDLPALAQLRAADEAAIRDLTARDFGGTGTALLAAAPTFTSMDVALTGRTQDATAAFNTTIDAAGRDSGLTAGGPVLALVALVMIALGIKPRLDEYRAPAQSTAPARRPGSRHLAGARR